MLGEKTAISVFEYQYRDASNYKVRGELRLSGTLSAAQKNQIVDKFDDGQFFVAEQIGVRPLYDMLYEFSDGPTCDDHVWHEFVGFRQNKLVVTQSNKPPVCASDFYKRIVAVDRWNIKLSPHCE